eukprot:COSAG04_NODE_10267_length_791_cov_0.849711_1_plen_176_part_01
MAGRARAGRPRTGRQAQQATVGGVAAVAEACEPPDCAFVVGGDASCTSIVGCSYLAATPAVAEACADTDSSGDDCSFAAGNPSSCGAGAVAGSCVSEMDCEFTVGDPSTCDTEGGCIYTPATSPPISPPPPLGLPTAGLKLPARLSAGLASGAGSFDVDPVARQSAQLAATGTGAE